MHFIKNNKWLQLFNCENKSNTLIKHYNTAQIYTCVSILFVGWRFCNVQLKWMSFLHWFALLFHWFTLFFHWNALFFALLCCYSFFSLKILKGKKQTIVTSKLAHCVKMQICCQPGFNSEFLFKTVVCIIIQGSCCSSWFSFVTSALYRIKLWYALLQIPCTW